jgi:D-alanyl-D-alanine carboxypeptidase
MKILTKLTVAGATLAALSTPLAATTAAQAQAQAQPTSTPPTTSARGDAAIQKSLDALVAETGYPGVMASVRGSDGVVRTYTAGKGNLETGKPVPANGRVRIASNTKMFTATVVLQLVSEGKISLDDTVEKYLPGVVRGHGNDGRELTVRNLLQQTSGLPDYDTLVTGTSDTLQSIAHTYFEPRQMVDAALDHQRSFKPGTKWEYSNTNYILLGLIVQRVTDRPVGEVITDRVIDRLHLKRTYWPATGEQRLRGPHPQGYWADAPGAPWEDITTMDPSLGWAAGQLVSTPTDLGRFMAALVSGQLLAPAQLAEMQTTVAAPGFEPEAGWRYGLGLATHELSCGVQGWGHGGDIQGFETRNLVTPDGRWAVVAVTGLATTLDMVADLGSAVDTAICAS